MKAIDFKWANYTFTKPENMSDAECHSVRAHVEQNEEKEAVKIHTVWQPGEADKKAIAEGRPIVLTIYGSGMPPVQVWTYDENSKANENEE